MHVFDEDLFSVSFPNVSCKMVAKAIEDNQNFGYLCLFLPLPLACWQIYTHAIRYVDYSSGKWLYLPATAGQLFLRFASKLVLNLSKICPPLKYSVNSLMIEEFIILLFWFHRIWRDCRKSSSLIGWQQLSKCLGLIHIKPLVESCQMWFSTLSDWKPRNNILIGFGKDWRSKLVLLILTRQLKNGGGWEGGGKRDDEISQLSSGDRNRSISRRRGKLKE